MFVQRFLLRHRSKKEFTRTSKRGYESLSRFIMESWRKHPLIAQKRTEWQKVPSAEWQEEQPSHECKVDYQKNGGTVRWIASVSCATCTTKRPMARQHSRKEMVKFLTDHQFPSEHWLTVGQVIWRQQIVKICKNQKPQKSTAEDS